MSKSAADRTKVPQHDGTQSVVFDTEPLITWMQGTEGTETVIAFLSDAYHRTIDAYISQVNLTEVWYVCAEIKDPSWSDTKINDIRDMGVQVIETDDIWQQAARYKHTYTPDFPLGDAFALAAASEQQVPLVTGRDSHWNDSIADDHDIIQIP
jgi:PIN domain nuclease of toxin-antitoxin system